MNEKNNKSKNNLAHSTKNKKNSLANNVTLHFLHYILTWH